MNKENNKNLTQEMVKLKILRFFAKSFLAVGVPIVLTSIYAIVATVFDVRTLKANQQEDRVELRKFMEKNNDKFEKLIIQNEKNSSDIE